MKRAAGIFQGLSDPTRLHIVMMLLEKERTVGEMVKSFDLAQGTVSKHLACLRWRGIVEARRDGRHVVYSLPDSRMNGLLEIAVSMSVERTRTVPMKEGADDC